MVIKLLQNKGKTKLFPTANIVSDGVSKISWHMDIKMTLSVIF